MKFAMGLMVAGCALAVGACGEEGRHPPLGHVATPDDDHAATGQPQPDGVRRRVGMIARCHVPSLPTPGTRAGPRPGSGPLSCPA